LFSVRIIYLDDATLFVMDTLSEWQTRLRRGRNMTLMYRSVMAGACAVALSIALTGIARAVPLSSSFERVIAGSADPCGSATCPGLGGVSVSDSDSSNQARASATATSSPALSASASGGGALGASATAEVDYFIEWLDPTRTAPIPTLVDLILHTAVSADAHDPNSFAEAIATFNIAAGSTIIQPAIGTSRLVSLAGGAGPDGFGPFCQTHPCSSPQNFSGTLTYNLDPNVLYSVQIAVTATTGDSILPSVGSTTQSAEASLDPHIYTNIPGLTLDISQGLDNVVGSAATPAGAPLPAALPLFATGLGAFGLLGWRRKKKSAALAA
jgi:hypothetical protein